MVNMQPLNLSRHSTKPAHDYSKSKNEEATFEERVDLMCSVKVKSRKKHMKELSSAKSSVPHTEIDEKRKTESKVKSKSKKDIAEYRSPYPTASKTRHLSQIKSTADSTDKFEFRSMKENFEVVYFEFGGKLFLTLYLVSLRAISNFMSRTRYFENRENSTKYN